MADLSLTTISMDLLKTEQEIQDLMPEHYKTQVSFDQRYYALLQQSMAGSAPMREADAKKALELEPIFEKHHDLKLKMRLLYSKKETLTTISSNLRSMSWSG